MENLKKWSLEIKNRMPLLLYGARQVGKTYAMQELGWLFEDLLKLKLIHYQKAVCP